MTPRQGGASAGRSDSDGSRGDRRMQDASKCNLEPAMGHGNAARSMAYQGSLRRPCGTSRLGAQPEEAARRAHAAVGHRQGGSGRQLTRVSGPGSPV